MASSGGSRRPPPSASHAAEAERRQSPTLERAKKLVDGLLLVALRFERVLEVLDLRAARKARRLAERLHVASELWVAEEDPASRAIAAAELQELIDAAELVLLVGDAAAPSTERPAPPASSVEVAKDVTEKRARVRDEDVPSSSDDATAWQSMLGVPRRRR